MIETQQVTQLVGRDVLDVEAATLLRRGEQVVVAVEQHVRVDDLAVREEADRRHGDGAREAREVAGAVRLVEPHRVQVAGRPVGARLLRGGRVLDQRARRSGYAIPSIDRVAQRDVIGQIGHVVGTCVVDDDRDRGRVRPEQHVAVDRIDQAHVRDDGGRGCGRDHEQPGGGEFAEHGNHLAPNRVDAARRWARPTSEAWMRDDRSA